MSHCHCPGGVSGLSAAQAASQITSGTIGANSSQTTLAPIALTGTGILGALSYLWSVDIVLPQDASYVNTSAPVAPTAQSTTLNPQGPADYLLSCVGTGAFGSNTFKRLQTVTRPYPVVSSSLGPEEQAAPGPYAPTLSETNGADGPLTWATTATKVSDGSSVSVTGASTTTPSFTVAAGQAYRALHRVTDAYGRYNDLVVAISTAGIVPMFVTVTQPSNASAAGAATWTLTPTGGTGPFTYSVSALTRPATSSASITGGTTATPSVSLDKQGRYAFTSTVTDSTGLAVTVNCIVSLVWTPLVPGATPAVQSLSANTTTSGTITFITPTGGSGSYTNALTLTKPSGSTAALSASTGLVTTITGMANGEAYAVTCTSTDADAGSAATCNSGPASVSVAAYAPSWHTAIDYDAAEPATFGALSAGNNVIGALTWTVTTAVPVTIDHTQGTGITVSAIVTSLQALQTNVQSVLTGGANANPVRVCMVVDSITINTNSQAIALCTTSGVQATTGSSRCPAFCLRLHRTSSTDFKMRTMTNGTGTTIGGTNGLTSSSGVTIAAALPSSAVYEAYLYGSLAGGLITTGTTTIPTAVDPFTVFEANATYNRATFMAAIADRTTAIDPWPALWAGPGITASGSLAYTYVIKRILVQEWY